MNNKLPRVVLSLSIMVCLLVTSTMQTQATEDSQNSNAGISFLPNPELPLYPDETDNQSEPFTEKSDRGTIEKEPKKLPQTGEKKVSPVYGLIIISLVVVMWYFRRNLLENKKNKNMEEQ